MTDDEREQVLSRIKDGYDDIEKLLRILQVSTAVILSCTMLQILIELSKAHS